MTREPAQRAFTEAQAEDPGLAFTDWLRERAEPYWSQAAGHRFTRELADDSLPDAVYRRYLIQDYIFLDVLVRIVGYAIASAPSLTSRVKLSAFLAAVTGEENTYFLRSFEALGVTEDDLGATPPNEATEAFQELMLGAAQSGGYLEILSVFLPAEWIYLEWAKRASAQSPQRFYLREWIELHSLPEFEAFVVWLRGELDREAGALPLERQESLAGLFRRIVELEAAFFEAAYE
ncbi:MAG: TenA family protein [Kiloniellales bacterium]|nr:TenA family protein [Kiloniellales bacterium]